MLQLNRLTLPGRVITVLVLSLTVLSGFAQSPGNVSSNLQLWLKADTGVLNSGSAATNGQAVNTWQYQTSARTNDATDVNLSPPTFRQNPSDNLNYNPVVGGN